MLTLADTLIIGLIEQGVNAKEAARAIEEYFRNNPEAIQKMNELTRAEIKRSYHPTLISSGKITNDIIPYNSARKTYRVGDGSTHLSDAHEPPSPNGKSLTESLDDLRRAVENLTVDIAVAVTPIVETFTKWVESPEVQTLINSIEDTRRADRDRAKHDLDQKRRELYGRKGRRGQPY